MPSYRYLSESSFARRVEEDPNGYARYFRMGRFSYFDKPEGEACVQKFAVLNYQAFWGTMPLTMVYHWAFKKVRNPLALCFGYAKAVWPFHAAASVFAVSACGMCSYRGKDDSVNWMVAGALTGCIPGLAARNYILRKNAYGTKLWVFTLPLGMFWSGLLAASVKGMSDPRMMTELFRLTDEKWQWNPEQYTVMTESLTMPGERISLDLITGGIGKDMPFSWIGEKWEDRRLLIKRDYGYLEGELDQVPAIEKAIRERM